MTLYFKITAFNSGRTYFSAQYLSLINSSCLYVSDFSIYNSWKTGLQYRYILYETGDVKAYICVGPQNCAQYICFNLLSFYFNWKCQTSELLLSVHVRSWSGARCGPFNKCPFSSDETLLRWDSVSKCLGIDLMVPLRVPSETSFETSLMSERFVIGRRIW